MREGIRLLALTPLLPATRANLQLRTNGCSVYAGKDDIGLAITRAAECFQDRYGTSGAGGESKKHRYSNGAVTVRGCFIGTWLRRFG